MGKILIESLPTIQRGLLQRGWLEKCSPFPPHSSISSHPFVDKPSKHLPRRGSNVSRADYVRNCENLLVRRLLQHYKANLYWTTRREKPGWVATIPRNIILNRYCRSYFACKARLSVMLQEKPWFYEAGVACTQFPRCYNTAMANQLLAFIDDYRITACMGFLKKFVEVLDSPNGKNIRSPDGSLAAVIVEFAITRCTEYVASATHKDIDTTNKQINGGSWDRFLQNYYLFMYKNSKFFDYTDSQMASLKTRAKCALAKISEHWPQYELDGMLNIWIVKPGSNSMGRGIRLMNNFNKLMPLLVPDPSHRYKYIVQKYIECPLLIYDTKFDIRQWFLVTSIKPLEVWMYKLSYLRFSSQKFDLSNFHESIHLTNYAIQKKYENGNRDLALPEENMWDSETFQKYLISIDKGEMWSDVIYPGMKQALVGAMLASQEYMEHRSNSFQLYGADFILRNDFTPWLLEINATPQMASVTKVTARLCPMCLEDVLKVTIDRRICTDINTGHFEQIYRQSTPVEPKGGPVALEVEGTQIMDPMKAKRRAALRGAHKGPVIGDMIAELETQSRVQLERAMRPRPATATGGDERDSRAKKSTQLNAVRSLTPTNKFLARRNPVTKADGLVVPVVDVAKFVPKPRLPHEQQQMVSTLKLKANDKPVRKKRSVTASTLNTIFRWVKKHHIENDLAQHVLVNNMPNVTSHGQRRKCKGLLDTKQ